MYLIGQQAMVFQINSANIVANKLVQGKVEYYFLPVYNARTIYPEYRPAPNVPA